MPETPADIGRHNERPATPRHYLRLGQELAQERKKLGVSQEVLAKVTGIDQAEISRIEHDLVDPQLGTYLKLLEGMALPYGWSRWSQRSNRSSRVG